MASFSAALDFVQKDGRAAAATCGGEPSSRLMSELLYLVGRGSDGGKIRAKSSHRRPRTAPVPQQNKTNEKVKPLPNETSGYDHLLHIMKKKIFAAGKRADKVCRGGRRGLSETTRCRYAAQFYQPHSGSQRFYSPPSRCTGGSRCMRPNAAAIWMRRGCKIKDGRNSAAHRGVPRTRSYGRPLARLRCKHRRGGRVRGHLHILRGAKGKRRDHPDSPHVRVLSFAPKSLFRHRCRASHQRSRAKLPLGKKHSPIFRKRGKSAGNVVRDTRSSAAAGFIVP